MKLKKFTQKKILDLSFFLIIIIQIFFLIIYPKPKIESRITILLLETVVIICIIIITLTLRDINLQVKNFRKTLKLYFYIGFILILIFSFIQIILNIYIQYFSPELGGTGTIGEGMTLLEMPFYTNFILISPMLIIIGVALMKLVTLKSKDKFSFDICSYSIEN
jgi:hypothetical protein